MNRVLIVLLSVVMVCCGNAVAAKGKTKRGTTDEVVRMGPSQNTATAIGSRMDAREFKSKCMQYAGQSVSVCGELTQVVKGMGERASATDFCILDGIVRCHFPKGVDEAEHFRRYIGWFAVATGVVTGGPGVTASANLMDCTVKVYPSRSTTTSKGKRK